MAAISSQDLLAQQRWRYATKQFDPARKIPAESWAALEQSLIFTPSSYGIQPWKFLILHQDQSIRERLVGHSWGQRQVADCSHYVVFTVRTEMTEADLDSYIELIATVRGVPATAMDGLRKMITGGVLKGMKPAEQREWAIRQAYIALGNIMTSAALLGIDTCPMEGIDPAKYDEVLGLQGSGYATCVGCAAGYRSVSDKSADLAKVRYPASAMIEHR